MNKQKQEHPRQKVSGDTHSSTNDGINPVVGNRILAIDSEVIKNYASFREIGWNQDSKINKEDDRIRSYFNSIGIKDDEKTFHAIELFEIYDPEGQLKKTISIPCFVTIEGKLLSLQKANPSLFSDLVIGRMNLIKSREVKNKQEQLIDSLKPMMESKKFSFVSLLPLIQDRSSLNFSIEVDRLAIAIDTRSEHTFDQLKCEQLQDVVREDDVIKTSIPLLNAGLVTHPKVAPLLAKLFESDNGKGANHGSKGSITI